MPELNFVSTNAQDTAGAKGLVQQPYLGTAANGYNYGGAGLAAGSGFMEFGTGTPGSLPFRVDQAGNVTAASFGTGTPGSAVPAFSLQAATAVAGYTLVNGTGNVITWTPPSDGNLHRFSVFSIMDCTSTETGGGIVVTFTLPDSTAATLTLYAAGKSSGVVAPNFVQAIAKAGTAVTVTQSSALTGGASKVWAEIWGS